PYSWRLRGDASKNAGTPCMASGVDNEEKHMIDTLMALWNKGHLKKIAKVLFTLALITMSIALLLIVAGGPIRTLLHHRETSDAQAGKTTLTPIASVIPTDTLQSATPFASSTAAVGTST